MTQVHQSKNCRLSTAIAAEVQYSGVRGRAETYTCMHTSTDNQITVREPRRPSIRISLRQIGYNQDLWHGGNKALLKTFASLVAVPEATQSSRRIPSLDAVAQASMLHSSLCHISHRNDQVASRGIHSMHCVLGDHLGRISQHLEPRLRA